MSPELKKALTELAEARVRIQKLAGERNGLLADRRKLTRERDEAAAAHKRIENAFFQKLIREATEASLEKHGGTRVLGIHVEKHLRAEPDGDRFPVVVVDEVGKILRGRSVDDVVREMRTDPDFAKAFRPKDEPGKKLAGNPWAGQPSTWSITEQARLLKTNRGYAIRCMREAGIDPSNAGVASA
jgi:hypothetical protein